MRAREREKKGRGGARDLSEINCRPRSRGVMIDDFGRFSERKRRKKEERTTTLPPKERERVTLCAQREKKPESRGFVLVFFKPCCCCCCCCVLLFVLFLRRDSHVKNCSFFSSHVTFSLKSAKHAKLKNSLILSLRSRAQIGVTDKRRDDAPPPPRESFE